jgi:hypothetical protein
MFGANREPILHWHCHCLQLDWNEIPHDQCQLGDPLAVSKTTSEPMVRSPQIVHLSCVKICTISKQTKTSIHLSLVTYEYHRVHLKWFLCPSYVWRKPCTYLALTLTVSPNGLKWDSTWPMSPRRSIGCVQNNFWPYVSFGANRAPILLQD